MICYSEIIVFTNIMKAILYTQKYSLCTNQRYLHGHPLTANIKIPALT